VAPKTLLSFFLKFGNLEIWKFGNLEIFQSEMVDEDGEEFAAVAELLGGFGGGHSDFAPLAPLVGRLQGNVPLLLRILRSRVRDPQFHRLQEAQTFRPALHQRTQQGLTFSLI